MIFEKEVVVGSVFKRIDKNGKEWIAIVKNRTDYYVDVEKHRPYPVKIATDDFGGYREEFVTSMERSAIHQEVTEVGTGEFITNVFGKYEKKKKVYGKIFINLTDEYSRNKYAKSYDKRYYLI